MSTIYAKTNIQYKCYSRNELYNRIISAGPGWMMPLPPAWPGLAHDLSRHPHYVRGVIYKACIFDNIGNIFAHMNMFWKYNTNIYTYISIDTKEQWFTHEKSIIFYITNISSQWQVCSPGICFNPSPPRATYIRQGTGSALIQIMACRLFWAKPLSQPMLVYCQLDP